MDGPNPFRAVSKWAQVPEEPAPSPDAAFATPEAAAFGKWSLREAEQWPSSGDNAEAVFHQSLVRIVRQFWNVRCATPAEFRDRVTDEDGRLTLYAAFIKVLEAWNDALTHCVPPKLLPTTTNFPTAALLEKMLPMMVMGLPYEEDEEDTSP